MNHGKLEVLRRAEDKWTNEGLKKVETAAGKIWMYDETTSLRKEKGKDKTAPSHCGQEKQSIKM